MHVLIEATEDQKKEIIDKKNYGDTKHCLFVNDIREVESFQPFDAFFLLKNKTAGIGFASHSNKPVLLNSVIETLDELNVGSNFSRINAWPGFLERPVYEVAANEKAGIAKIFEQLGWKVLFVKDEPGFVAARVLAMVINEAYFALGEKISTTQEIDTAMKLGTNYPMGPFDWINKIGINNIYGLLKKLSATDKRCVVAPLLEQEFKEAVVNRFL